MSLFDTTKLFEIKYDFDSLKRIIDYLLKRDKENLSTLEHFEAEISVLKITKSGGDPKIAEKIIAERSLAASAADLRIKRIEEKQAEIEEILYKLEKTQSDIHNEKKIETTENTHKIQGSMNKQNTDISNNEIIKKLEQRIEKLEQELSKKSKPLDKIRIKPLQTEDTSHKIFDNENPNDITPPMQNTPIIQPSVAEKEEEKSQFNTKRLETPKENPIPQVSQEIKPIIQASDSIKSSEISPYSGSQILQEDFELLSKQTAHNTGEINRMKELYKQIIDVISQKTNSADFNNLEKNMKDQLKILETKIPDISKLQHISNINDSQSSFVMNPIMNEKITWIEQKLSELNKFCQGINMPAIENKLLTLYEALKRKSENTELETQIEKINSIIDSQKTKLSSDLNENKDETLKSKAKIELLQSKISFISKTINEIHTKIDSEAFKDKNSPTKNQFAGLFGANISETDWENNKNNVAELNKSVTEIFGELEILRDLRKKYIGFQGIIEQKMDKKEFEIWRDANNLEVIIAEVTKLFVEKTDMRKTIGKLKLRLQMIENMFAKNETPENAPDAILAKKPLGGWSCASCQKDLKNFGKQKLSFYPWAKMPSSGKNPTIGYSRMLSLIKPEIISKSQANLAISSVNMSQNNIEENEMNDPQSERDKDDANNAGNPKSHSNSSRNILPNIGLTAGLISSTKKQ